MQSAYKIAAALHTFAAIIMVYRWAIGGSFEMAFFATAAAVYCWMIFPQAPEEKQTPDNPKRVSDQLQ